MSIQLTENKKHLVIKRDGREEPFSEEKLMRLLLWASDGKEIFAKKILEAVTLKINDKIKVTKLFDELIRTTSNMINPLYSFYDDIAKKLYIMKIYKDTCDLKKSGEYPHLKTFLDKGVKFKVYDRIVLDKFSKEDIEELNKMIVPDRDFLFTFKGAVMMYTKYCKRYRKQTIELPQITYMTAAMYSFYNDYYKNGNKSSYKKSKKKRLGFIKRTYDMLSKHEVTFATPRIANSFTNNPQLASCVLNTPDDDTWSLNHTDGNMALYSKFSGGIAYDASLIRASGSTIESNKGVSDGPIPFIKRTEQTISSFNQSGFRKGSCVVTYPWWHMDVQDLILLKDAGGTEDQRARKLQYSIKLDKVFRSRVNKDDYITLFDPKETPLLNETYGAAFAEVYKHYENKSGIRKKRIKAKELLFNLLKVRSETGNLYIFFTDNVNEQNVRNVFVGASNLCCVSGDTQILTNIGWSPINKSSVKRDIGYADFTKNIEILWDGNSYVPSYVFPTSYEDQKLLNIKVINTVFYKDKIIGTFYADAWFTEYHLWKLNNNELVTTEYIINKLPDEAVFELASYNILFKDLRSLVEINNLELKFIKNAPTLVDYDFVRVVGKIYFTDNYEETDEGAIFKKIKDEPTYCAYVPSNNMLLFNGIYAHNCEITVPSSPSKLISEKVYKTFDSSYEIHNVIKSGEVGICNLASVNLMAWVTFSESKKNEFCYDLLRGCDNILDTQFYPVVEGEVSNKRNRPIGIGVLNYANLLASNKLKYTDKKTEQFTFDIFEDLYYHIYKASNQLAQERGTYHTFRSDKWIKGHTPVSLSLFKYKDFGLEFKNKDRWDKLANEIKKTGVRFSLHSAIAPTACMSLDSEITELENSIKIGDFLEKWGINVDDIHKTNTPQWVYFKEKPTINTRFGTKEIGRAWYNGKRKTRTIIFEDGSKVDLTYNHPLLIKNRGWVKVKDLQEGDDIIEIGDNYLEYKGCDYEE